MPSAMDISTYQIFVNHVTNGCLKGVEPKTKILILLTYSSPNLSKRYLCSDTGEPSALGNILLCKMSVDRSHSKGQFPRKGRKERFWVMKFFKA